MDNSVSMKILVWLKAIFRKRNKLRKKDKAKNNNKNSIFLLFDLVNIKKRKLKSAEAIFKWTNSQLITLVWVYVIKCCTVFFSKIKKKRINHIEKTFMICLYNFRIDYRKLILWSRKMDEQKRFPLSYSTDKDDQRLHSLLFVRH